MTSHEHESGTTKQPIGLNRRTLIRTGAHVAWAVPAVAMVTPARAAAASPLADLSVTATNGGWTGNTANAARFTVTFNVTNTSDASADGLGVSFTLPTGVTTQTLNVPPGWYQDNASGTNVVTLIRNPPSPLAAGASAGGTMSFDVDDPFAFILIPVNITATANAPITPGSTSTTVAATPPVLTLVQQGTWSSPPANPARMNFTSRRLGNTRGTTTTGLKVELTLPTGLRDVLSASATGNPVWTAVVDPSVATTGLVTFTPSAQLAGAEAFTIKPQLTFATGVEPRTGTVVIEVSATNPGANVASGTATKAP